MAMPEQERWQISGDGPAQYERYTVARMFEPLARVLLQGVPLRAGQRVLDVACGTGIVARLAAPGVLPSGMVVGLDMNPAMLAIAQACAEQEGLHIEWKKGEANALPFAAGSFDCVLCQQGLQFFPDRIGALREMRRVTAPGGAMALAVFGAPGPFIEALSQALDKYVGAPVAAQCLAPFALADRDAIDGLAREAGIDRCDIRTVHLTRRIEPTQQWLLEFTAGLPYAAATAAMDPGARAAMVREIAAKLKHTWNEDSFAVPAEVHLIYARDVKRGA